MTPPKGSFGSRPVCAKWYKFAQQNKLNLYSQPNHMNLVNSLDMALLCFSASRSEPEKVKVERVVNIWFSPRYLVAHVLIVDGSALLIIDPLTRPGRLLIVSRAAPPGSETSVVFALQLVHTTFSAFPPWPWCHSALSLLRPRCSPSPSLSWTPTEAENI